MPESEGSKYAQISEIELKKERQRLADALVVADAPADAFERGAALILRKSDTANPIARELAFVEEELLKRKMSAS